MQVTVQPAVILRIFWCCSEGCSSAAWVSYWVGERRNIGIRLSVRINLIWTSKLQLSPCGRCQSLQRNVSCPAEHLHCWWTKFLVTTRPRLKPLCRWGQSEVRQYNRSLWGFRPCHPFWPRSCFCSALTVLWWSWASSTFLGTPQEWGEWEGSSSLLFPYPAGNAQLSTAKCQHRAPSFAESIRGWALPGTGPGSFVRSFQLHTLRVNWSPEEGQQGWERQNKILPSLSHPLFKNRILQQYFDILPSTSHKLKRFCWSHLL